MKTPPQNLDPSTREKTVSRRAFMQQSAALASTGWLAAVWPAVASAATFAREARASGQPLSALTASEAATLDAITDMFIPSGDGLPGARDAGVVHFMDRALETFMAPALESFRGGLAEFEDGVRAAHPGVASFASLAGQARSDMMERLVETPLFRMIQYLTLAGMFALPSYGGNKDKVGWRLIGFEDRHVWQPPFGYYDEQEEHE